MTRSTALRFSNGSAVGLTAALLLIAGTTASGDDDEANDRASKAVYAKLEERVTMQFPNPTPLENVLKYVKAASQGPNDSGIPYAYDKEAMTQVRKSGETRVTIDSTGEPLKDSLRKLLKPVGLTYVVKKGVLTITVDAEKKKNP